MRIIYENGHHRGFPRYFKPRHESLRIAESIEEARDNIKRVIGKTRKANINTSDYRVIERRRNKDFIATIIEDADDTAAMDDKTYPPREISGAQVEIDDSYEPLEKNGYRWVVFRPLDDNDSRLWEYDLISGRIIQTH